ncbi:hypothetical protein ACVWY3_005025 [Bradyrhizobium sp. USDA 4486]
MSGARDARDIRRIGQSRLLSLTIAVLFLGAICGVVERMNRTIKEATVQRYHYDRHDQLEAHLADFIDAYNYARG